jgi:hypothetical protein
MAPELVLNLGNEPGDAGANAFINRATDPVVTNVATPTDFAAQYPQPLDPTEIIARCEEVNLWRSIPSQSTELKAEQWRELNELAFSSGSSYVAFADGACPEEYYHDGDNTTVTLKNIGAKKSLTLSDIKHSAAVAGMNGLGIAALAGGASASAGFPGGADVGTLLRKNIADLKAKEMALMSVLVLNGWDRLLAVGDASSNALEFNGIETQVTSANGAHVRATLDLMASGTFSAASFDRFLGEGCARPDTIYGAPQAIQEMLAGYFALGFAAAPQQVIQHPSGEGIVPGYNFAGEVITGVGRMRVVADSNFTTTAMGISQFRSTLYPLRTRLNGEPLVYRADQFPLVFSDLAPGCTAIAFQIWAKTALIIKAMCAQSAYQGIFTGRITTTCPRIG